MSVILKKLLLLSLALVLSFSMVAFVGCKEELPQEEIDQIIAGALAAQYDTVSFDMDMPMTVKMTGGTDPGTMTVDTSATGSIDNNNEMMRMEMTMEMDMSGEGSESMDAEIYVLEGWMYTGMNIPGYGEQWAKMALTEDMWQQQLSVEQYVELLATAIEVDYKGIETVNGVECYVFELEPNMAALNELLAGETSGLGMAGLGDIDLAELYEALTVKEWLAKDSYLLQRTEIEIVIEMSPGDVGATSNDFDKMSVSVEMTMRFFDYNQPFTVVLPPEALEAEEMPLSY